jgi:hypothetical protein
MRAAAVDGEHVVIDHSLAPSGSLGQERAD